uniref:Uncharacterized protein n=1 Tax=Glossina pallidipes TaxID=7398 RepID=A0A1B0A3A9_GLOPL
MAEAGRENLNYDFIHPFDLLWENNSVKLLLKSTIALCVPKSCHICMQVFKENSGYTLRWEFEASVTYIDPPVGQPFKCYSYDTLPTQWNIKMLHLIGFSERSVLNAL